MQKSNFDLNDNIEKHLIEYGWYVDQTYKEHGNVFTTTKISIKLTESNFLYHIKAFILIRLEHKLLKCSFLV
ncbi:hypothetical protein OHV77_17645 [Acinetobacter baumannii]|nr:hypothetical protein [Acinetobacter baumannii]